MHQRGSIEKCSTQLIFKRSLGWFGQPEVWDNLSIEKSPMRPLTAL